MELCIDQHIGPGRDGLCQNIIKEGQVANALNWSSQGSLPFLSQLTNQSALIPILCLRHSFLRVSQAKYNLTILSAVFTVKFANSSISMKTAGKKVLSPTMTAMPTNPSLYI